MEKMNKIKNDDKISVISSIYAHEVSQRNMICLKF